MWDSIKKGIGSIFGGSNPQTQGTPSGSSNPFLAAAQTNSSTPNPYARGVQSGNPFTPNPPTFPVQTPQSTAPIQPFIKTANAQTTPQVTPTNSTASNVGVPGQGYWSDTGWVSGPIPQAYTDKVNSMVSGLNLQPVTPVTFGVNNSGNTFNSNLLNTGTTRDQVYAALGDKQQALANGTDPSLQGTTGYQKFISDYSNAVKITPEQQAAYTGQQQTQAKIQDIQRGLENRRAELTQNGALSPAQVEADMKQYTTQANSQIADLMSQNRDYTLTFNSLEQQRKNTLDAFQVQAPFYKPTDISPGSQLIDPSTGQIITQGTGVSPQQIQSTAASLEQSAVANGTIQRLPDGSVDHQFYNQQAQQLIRQSYGMSSGIGGSISSGGSPVNQDSASGLPPVVQQYVINGANGVQYINEDKIPAAQRDYVKQQAAANGVAYLTGEDISKYRNIEVTSSNLDNLQAVVQKVNTPGVVGRTLGAGINTLQSIFQTNQDISSFGLWRDTAINTIQALAGGSGSGFRLNQAEIDTATGNLPTIRDNIETANNKINLLRGFLSKWQSELLHGNPNEKIGTGSSTTGNSSFVGSAWK